MCRTFLQRVEQSPETFGRVQERAEPGVVEGIRQAARLGWVPAKTFAAFARTHHEVVGEDEYRTQWQSYSSNAGLNPLFRSLLEGGQRIFSKHPAGLLKWIPRAWNLATRECGTYEVETDEVSKALVTLDELAFPLRDHTTALSVVGSVMGVCDLVGLETHVELDASAVERGRIELELRFSPRTIRGDTKTREIRPVV